MCKNHLNIFDRYAVSVNIVDKDPSKIQFVLLHPNFFLLSYYIFSAFNCSILLSIMLKKSIDFSNCY